MRATSPSHRSNTPAENCHTTANTSMAQYCGMSRKAEATRNKASSNTLIAFGLKPKRTNKSVKGLERWELTSLENSPLISLKAICQKNSLRYSYGSLPVAGSHQTFSTNPSLRSCCLYQWWIKSATLLYERCCK